MPQLEPSTKIAEPIPKVARPGRPSKEENKARESAQVRTSQYTLIPPMPEGLEVGVWSDQSKKVLKERYLLKNDAGEFVETEDQMCWRVA